MGEKQTKSILKKRNYLGNSLKHISSYTVKTVASTLRSTNSQRNLDVVAPTPETKKKVSLATRDYCKIKSSLNSDFGVQKGTPLEYENPIRSGLYIRQRQDMKSLKKYSFSVFDRIDQINTFDSHHQFNPMVRSSHKLASNASLNTYSDHKTGSLPILPVDLFETQWKPARVQVQQLRIDTDFQRTFEAAQTLIRPVECGQKMSKKTDPEIIMPIKVFQPSPQIEISCSSKLRALSAIQPYSFQQAQQTYERQIVPSSQDISEIHQYDAPLNFVNIGGRYGISSSNSVQSRESHPLNRHTNTNSISIQDRLEQKKRVERKKTAASGSQKPIVVRINASNFSRSRDGSESDRVVESHSIDVPSRMPRLQKTSGIAYFDRRSTTSLSKRIGSIEKFQKRNTPVLKKVGVSEVCIGQHKPTLRPEKMEKSISFLQSKPNQRIYIPFKHQNSILGRSGSGEYDIQPKKKSKIEIVSNDLFRAKNTKKGLRSLKKPLKSIPLIEFGKKISNSYADSLSEIIDTLDNRNASESIAGSGGAINQSVDQSYRSKVENMFSQPQFHTVANMLSRPKKHKLRYSSTVNSNIKNPKTLKKDFSATIRTPKSRPKSRLKQKPKQRLRSSVKKTPIKKKQKKRLVSSRSILDNSLTVTVNELNKSRNTGTSKYGSIKFFSNKKSPRRVQKTQSRKIKGEYGRLLSSKEKRLSLFKKQGSKYSPQKTEEHGSRSSRYQNALRQHKNNTQNSSQSRGGKSRPRNTGSMVQDSNSARQFMRNLRMKQNSNHLQRFGISNERSETSPFQKSKMFMKLFQDSSTLKSFLTTN